MDKDIILQGAPNARDLGGIKTIDGRTLKHNRLIRSGMLYEITAHDEKYLLDCGLNRIVDLRSTVEKRQKPDKVPNGVNYIDCPILDGKAGGITHEKPADFTEEARQTVLMAEHLLPKYNDGRKQMESLYSVLVTIEHSVSHYAEFFKILLRHEDGALLYHCTMGKDRVGVATMLLLSALGVDKEAIIADYMITRERCAPGTQRLIEECRKFTDDEKKLEFIYLLDTVEPEYLISAFDTIDSAHGSMDNFLRDKLGLTDADFDRLKELYLD